MDLLVELEPLRKLTYVAFKVVDVSRENPPHYAQAFIVPATYIGERLWRYGRFPQQALHIRLQQEINHAKLD